jgi:anti-sigma regulatory factor (Ser/Thr protein kinase)
VKASLFPDEVRLVVRDQGPGFDVSAVPNCDDLEALELERGRGLSLMRTLMDEVIFNDKGNEVTLVKRRETEGLSSLNSA